MKPSIRHLGLAFLLLLASLQLVPYGRNHSNPPIRQEPPWDAPRTRELAVRACFDCHSNQVVWPWYARIAPASWLLQHDIDKGRSELNFSEWDRPQREAKEAAETIQNGEMPPGVYLLLHSSARLSATERLGLIRGLQATLGSEAKGVRHD